MYGWIEVKVEDSNSFLNEPRSSEGEKQISLCTWLRSLTKSDSRQENVSYHPIRVFVSSNCHILSDVSSAIDPSCAEEAVTQHPGFIG